MKEEEIRKFAIITVSLAVIILSFLLVQSILISIISGFILAYVFNPLYQLLVKFLKYKNLAAFLVCIIVLLLIFIPIWFLAPSIIKQTFEVYRVSQQIDFISPIKKVFPQLFTSEEFSAEMSRSITLFLGKTVNSLMGSVSNL